MKTTINKKYEAVITEHTSIQRLYVSNGKIKHVDEIYLCDPIYFDELIDLPKIYQKLKKYSTKGYLKVTERRCGFIIDDAEYLLEINLKKYNSLEHAYNGEDY